jgi:capsular polysaccharide transport system ATP-binding protein
MISLKKVTKAYRQGAVTTTVLQDVDLELNINERMAVLGVRGSGKTTLLHLLAGLERPSRGKIERYCSISLPIGYPRAFKPILSCRENAAFLARCYGANVSEVVGFVQEISGIGSEFDVPLRLLPPEPRVRFVFAMGYALPFDVYLIDGTPAAGGTEFREKCLAMLEERSKTAGFLYATSDPRLAKRFCQSGLLIANQRLVYFPDLEEAIWNLNGLNRDAV